MPRRLSDVERERALEDFLAQARVDLDRALRSRSQGKPATFDQIESSALEVGLNLARRLMQHEVALEEGEEGDTAPCPVCHRMCPKCGPIQKREIRTEAGPVGLTRREFYCKPCRRAFFPSGSGFGARY